MQVRVWDVAAETTIKTIHGHSDSVNGVAWSSDGTSIASGSCDNTAMVTRPAEFQKENAKIVDALKSTDHSVLLEAVSEQVAKGEFRLLDWLMASNDTTNFVRLLSTVEASEFTDKIIDEFKEDVPQKRPQLLVEVGTWIIGERKRTAARSPESRGDKPPHRIRGETLRPPPSRTSERARHRAV